MTTETKIQFPNETLLVVGSVPPALGRLFASANPECAKMTLLGDLNLAMSRIEKENERHLAHMMWRIIILCLDPGQIIVTRPQETCGRKEDFYQIRVWKNKEGVLHGKGHISDGCCADEEAILLFEAYDRNPQYGDDPCLYEGVLDDLHLYNKTRGMKWKRETREQNRRKWDVFTIGR